jgi:subtilisin family serine protease
MKKIAIIGLALLLALPVGASVSFAQTTAQNDTHVKVLIGFDKPVGASERALVHAFGGKIKYSYSVVNAIAVELPNAALAGLSRNPHVTAIEADVQMYAVDAELDDSWGVAHIQAGEVHQNGNKGAGVKIGIIDSGVNYNHPDLNDNFDPVNLGYDFYYYDTDPMDVYGHGTHVAGSACAEDNFSGVVGVAPECDLYSLRVLNDDGVGYASDIMAAVDWSTGQEIYLPGYWEGDVGAPEEPIQGIKMDIINLSLGQSSHPGSIVEQAFDNAYYNHNILIVAAAGNSGNKGGKSESIIYPAKFSSVIAVGATDPTNTRASFSSTGETLELSAPGVSVYSTWNDSTSYSSPSPVCVSENECYKYGSGTSMASPHVAGVAALVIAAGVTDAAQVRSILQATALDLGSSGRDGQYGYGLVQAEAAVQAADPNANMVPIANAGADQNVEDTDENGSEDVLLDGSGSFDPDGTILSFEWSHDDNPLGSGEMLLHSFAIGEYTLTLTVTDDEGAQDTDTVHIVVSTPSLDNGGNNCPPGLAKKGTCTP